MAERRVADARCSGWQEAGVFQRAELDEVLRQAESMAVRIAGSTHVDDVVPLAIAAVIGAAESLRHAPPDAEAVRDVPQCIVELNDDTATVDRAVTRLVMAWVHNAGDRAAVAMHESYRAARDLAFHATLHGEQPSKWRCASVALLGTSRALARMLDGDVEPRLQPLRDRRDDPWTLAVATVRLVAEG
jgi:hypothetical protein